ncbi:MAG TPA: NAD(P)-binding domain-containing protein [Streptosporangiaceae bacterium]|nr:NAD(P)-binding domain-containing protein [Streptosporangiaceae bacterium]
MVGAGPAGLQLSYYLQQVGSDYLTVERVGAPGDFFRRFPRHRRLISLNKWNTSRSCAAPARSCAVRAAHRSTSIPSDRPSAR